MASADIYKYTAPDGRVYYTDKPKYKYKRMIKSRHRSAASFWKNKKRFSPIIKKVAAKYDLDENLLHALIYAESTYNAHAVSASGAVGLMQLMPGTARRYGVKNRYDPIQNVEGGARYLKYLLKLFNFDTRLAIAAYHAGEGAVKKYHNRIPPYPETRNYVEKVLRFYYG